jgi:hypothetical protein
MTPNGLGIKVFRVYFVPTPVNQIEPGRKLQGNDPLRIDSPALWKKTGKQQNERDDSWFR